MENETTLFFLLVLRWLYYLLCHLLWKCLNAALDVPSQIWSQIFILLWIVVWLLCLWIFEKSRNPSFCFLFPVLNYWKNNRLIDLVIFIILSTIKTRDWKLLMWKTVPDVCTGFGFSSDSDLFPVKQHRTCCELNGKRAQKLNVCYDGLIIHNSFILNRWRVVFCLSGLWS